MTEKELKKLNRYQLLELIILQTEQMDSLRSDLQAAQKALEEKQIHLSNAGSIAEASLQLSGIFEAAQAAADIYLEQVKAQTQNFAQMEEDARAKAAAITGAAETEAEAILADARAKAVALTAQQRQEAEILLKNATAEAEVLRTQSQELWEQTLRRCEEREQAVNASIQSIREAFRNQFMNLDNLTQTGADAR